MQHKHVVEYTHSIAADWTSQSTASKWMHAIDAMAMYAPAGWRATSALHPSQPVIAAAVCLPAVMSLASCHLVLLPAKLTLHADLFMCRFAGCIYSQYH